MSEELRLGPREYIEMTGPSVGDPVFPPTITVRHFRRDEIGQAFVVGERSYALAASGATLDVERLTRALASMSNYPETERLDPGDYMAGIPTVQEFAEAIVEADARLSGEREAGTE